MLPLAPWPLIRYKVVKSDITRNLEPVGPVFEDE